MSNLKKIIIDDIEVEVDGAMTIIQAAEVAGIEIPRFCYHERLSIAGNCRM
ncbi:MAG TPA: 2Fe-2S iron-sulfur cluster-binding protein, partial [Gemmobacter sp.]|nr:2Fe-2S iron-sulfur cluster-binding protein [Gemmobacter sp.]